MNYFECSVINGTGGSGSKIIVTCDAAFAGTTISCTKGTLVYTQTCPSTSPYQVTFEGLENGTWTISGTAGGQVWSSEVIVEDIEINLIYGFNWRQWLIEGRVTQTFESLDDILEDEPTLRQLFLVHDSVDYLAKTFVITEDIEKIFNTDLAAKWINLSDYALDHFYAVEGIKSIMNTADKYGYGEWALVPQVPKMTSNTAPFGIARGSSVESNNDYYKAFDNSTDSFWGANSHSAGAYIEYEFLSPIKCVMVKTLPRYFTATSGTYNTYVKCQGYDTELNEWIDLTDSFTITYTARTAGDRNANIHKFDRNIKEYKRYRLYFQNSTQSVYPCIAELQFYAWGPKGNVPVMTSNTAPYGTVIYSGVLNTGAEVAPYRAFDGTAKQNYCWHSNNVAPPSWLGYKSVNPICVKKVYLRNRNATGSNNPFPIVTFKIQGSNDNSTWTDLTDTIANTDLTSNGESWYEISNNSAYYLYHRIYALSAMSGTNYVCIQNLQFYGRELKVSVPKMTSNTAPLGEAFASSQYSSSYAPWYAFRKVTTDNDHYWATATNQVTNQYLGYKFVAPTVIKRITIRNKKVVANVDRERYVKDFKLQYSQDGTTWSDASEVLTNRSVDNGLTAFDITENINALCWRIFIINNTGSSTEINVMDLQFYGLDYSEKEFEVGTTKKWLYDHGLELETLDKYKGSNTTSTIAYNDGNSLIFDALTPSSNGYTYYNVVGKTIDLTNYLWLRAIIGNIYTNNASEPTNSLRVYNTDGIPLSGTYSSSGVIASVTGGAIITNPIMDFTVDLSNINGNEWVSVGVYYYQNLGMAITEWWLE